MKILPRSCQMKNVKDFSCLMGLSLKEAQDWGKINNMKIRCSIVDGEPRIGTCDFRFDRINISVKDNKVIKVISVG